MLKVRSVTEYSAQGSYRTTMQDVLAKGKNVFNGAVILGAFDGHGPRGEYVAEIASRAVNYAKFHEFPDDHNALAIAQDIGAVLMDMSKGFGGYRRFKKAVRASGSTAAMAVIYRGSMAWLWSGDSDIYFMPDNETSNAIRLIQPHNISNTEAKQDALDAGAKVIQIRGNDYLSSDQTPNDGLLLTRAVGDVEFPFINHQPEYSVMSLTRPGWVALGTDGFFGHELSEATDTAIRENDLDVYYVNMMADLHRDNAAVIVARVG